MLASFSEPDGDTSIQGFFSVGKTSRQKEEEKDGLVRDSALAQWHNAHSLSLQILLLVLATPSARQPISRRTKPN
jgi:hypothetical protein